MPAAVPRRRGVGCRARPGLRRVHRRRCHRLGPRRHHLRLTQRLGLLAPHRVLHLLLLVLHHPLRLEALTGLGLTLGLLCLESLLPLHRLLAHGLFHPQPLQPVIRPRRAGGGGHAGRLCERAQSRSRRLNRRRPNRLHGTQRCDRGPHALGLQALWRRRRSGRSLRRAGGEGRLSRSARRRGPGLRGGRRVFAGNVSWHLA